MPDLESVLQEVRKEVGAVGDRDASSYSKDRQPNLECTMTSANLTQTIIDRLQTLPLQKQQQVLATLEDEDLLSNISPAELHALSAIALAQPLQTQLSDLLDRNSENQLSPEDLIQLDRILEQVDQLNLLKARALYTLDHFRKANLA